MVVPLDKMVDKAVHYDEQRVHHSQDKVPNRETVVAGKNRGRVVCGSSWELPCGYRKRGMAQDSCNYQNMDMARAHVGQETRSA